MIETIKKMTAKQWLIIALCAFGLYAIYKMLKGSSVAPNAVKIKNSDGTVSDYNPAPITDALYNDISGFIAWSRNKEPYKKLSELSDAKFKAVFQDWAKRYASTYGMRLGAAIAAEWDSITNSPDNIVGSFSYYKRIIANRVEQLGLE